MQTLFQFLILSLLFCPASVWSESAANRVPELIQNADHSAEKQVIAKWQGVWLVKANIKQPKPKVDTYEESFDWFLDGQFLRSETSRKTEGDRSSSMMWFDAMTKNYRFVIYDSSGMAIELPPPKWDADKQTMTWESSLFAPVSYEGYNTFINPDTIEWKSVLKDWTGKVYLDMEGISIRKK